MQEKEQLYLDAKLAYYNGNPVMSNSEFDLLETELKELGSKVIHQVGYKISDYDYPHPTRMYSLDKIQTVEGDMTYSYAEFEKWVKSIPNYQSKLNTSKLRTETKYDGNSVNVILKNGKLYKILTRGDGTYGKDVTNHIAHRFDASRYFYDELPNDGVVEVRCEAIMQQSVFEEKYSSVYANSRNLIGGLLGRDYLSKEDSQYIDLVPLQVLHNSEHIDIQPNTCNESMDFGIPYYTNMFESYIALRDTFKYQIDGIVVSFPPKYREEIGNGEKAPKWAIALKFVPDEKITFVKSIDWQIGKTNELTPVANVEPIQLAGTSVSRVTCFNAGFVVKNNISIGTNVSVCKRGDIIPHIEEVFDTTNTSATLPQTCPYCKHKTVLRDIHLYCTNKSCSGAAIVKLNDSVKVLNLKGIGPATLEFFASSLYINNGVEFIQYAKDNIDDMEALGFQPTHKKSYENFVDAIKSVKVLTTEQVILLLNINGIGPKIATQLSKEFSGVTPDYTGIDSKFTSKSFLSELLVTLHTSISTLRAFGVDVMLYKEEVYSEDTIFVEMTGSPKDFGFKTKKDWLSTFNGRVVQCSMSDPRCAYLVTDDTNGTSAKMKQAAKKGLKIVSYGFKF